jgi:hypothetical protein
VLVSDGYTSRRETARCLGVVSRYQRLLRRHAESIGIRIYGEKPHRYLRRVERLWQGGRTPSDARHARGTA